MSNAEQILYWNGKVGETWVKMQERMDRALSPVTAALLSLSAPQPGENVLDIGCGSGETTLALAGAVGDDGHATGVDISEPLLARARARSEELLSEANFICADASTFQEEPGFDLIVSRFGVMFFADPVAALTNIHALAAPRGRLCFACWQPPADNGWATFPLTTLAALMPQQPSPDPYAPGPFAFADPERVHGILSAAGWTDIVFHAVPFTMVIGEGDDPVTAAVDFNLRIGPAARAIRDAGREFEPEARAVLAAALAAYRVDDAVGLPAAVWLVSARS